MKSCKKLIVLFLSISILLSLSVPFASAESDDPSLTISAFSDWKQLLSTSNSFDINDNGVASMTADTQGFSHSTKVTVDMYLERLQNGTWTEVSGMSWSTSSTSKTYVVLDKTRTVASGYYYRLRSEHSAKGPNGTEYDTIYSGIVLYNK